MIVYNVTVKIDRNASIEWLNWMKTVHIPEVLATGMFLSSRISRLLGMEDEDEGDTYSIQYVCHSQEKMKEYQEKHAPELQKKHTERYKGRFVAFRTLMHIEGEFTHS